MVYFLSLFCILQVRSLVYHHCSTGLLNLVQYFDPLFKLAFEPRVFPHSVASSWTIFFIYIFGPSLLHSIMYYYAFDSTTLNVWLPHTISMQQSSRWSIREKNEQFSLCRREGELFRKFWLWNYAENFHSCPSNRWKRYLLIRQMPLKLPAFRLKKKNPVHMTTAISKKVDWWIKIPLKWELKDYELTRLWGSQEHKLSNY